MQSKYLFCEVFESNPSIYVTDNEYGMFKIGAFIATDFDVTIGNCTTSSTGSVNIPESVTLSTPLKVGDIIQVVPVNYDVHTRSIYNVDHDDTPFFFDGNTDRRCFAIKSVDGNKLLLSDYVEYSMSYIQLGYVGNVTDEPWYSVLYNISHRDMRAFAMKMWQYSSDADVPYLPFFTNIPNKIVSFRDNFENTNVTPYSILLSLLEAVAGKDTLASISLGSVIQKDDKGYYVVPYILQNNIGVNHESIMLKPGGQITTTPLNAPNVANVWIQRADNSDDYVRLGLFMSTGATDTESDVTPIHAMSISTFINRTSITNIPTILIGYNDLFPSKVSDTSSDEDKAADEERIKALKSTFNEFNLTRLNHIMEYEWKVNLRPHIPSSRVMVLNDPNYKWYQDQLAELTSRLRELMKMSLVPEYSPVEFTLGEDDYYSTNNDLNTSTLYRVKWNSQYGIVYHGVYAVCSSITYTNTGRSYTITTVRGD